MSAESDHTAHQGADARPAQADDTQVTDARVDDARADESRNDNVPPNAAGANGDQENGAGDDHALIEAVQGLLGDEYSRMRRMHKRLESDDDRAGLVAASLSGAIGDISRDRTALKRLTEAVMPLAIRVQARLERQRRRRLHLTWLLIVVLVGAGIWQWQQYRHREIIAQREAWQGVLERFRQEPGYMVSEISQQVGGYQLHGLRDPLSRPPMTVAHRQVVERLGIAMHWTPIAVRHDPFVLERARRRLDPPETVDLSLRDGSLILSGSAPRAWIRAIRLNLAGLNGVDAVDDRQLTAVDTPTEARQTVLRTLESMRFTFTTEQAPLPRELTAGEDAKGGDQHGEKVAAALKHLFELDKVLGQKSRIIVTAHMRQGHYGRLEAMALALERAQRFVSEMMRRGVASEPFALESHLLSSGVPAGDGDPVFVVLRLKIAAEAP